MSIRYLCESGACPELRLPLFASRVSAGFPSPADDYVEGRLDLNKHLIAKPSATFFARAGGDSMTGVGIYSGDLLIVDRSARPVHHSIVVAVLNGELTCKLLDMHRHCLLAANPAYPPIAISAGSDFAIEGVVLHSIRHHVRPG
jgi:DNA polymerase V